MSRQNIVILLLFVTSLAIWRWFDNQGTDNNDARNTIFQPTYTTRDLVTRHYDDKGQLKEELRARYAEHYAPLEMTELDLPEIRLNDAEGKATWQINARHGTLNQGDTALLRDNVNLISLDPASVIQRVMTEYLEMDLASKQVRTNLKVEMEGAEFHNQGMGFKGMLDQKIYQLLDKSHAVYFNKPD
jgi:Uncharacterized protein conserved in bacteria